MRRRICLFFVTVFAICFVAFRLPAYADTIDFAARLEPPSADKTIIDSGTCGDNMMWKLTSDYTIYIVGSGDMTDYGGFSPWEYYKYDVKNVIICAGVNTISQGAFYGFRNIENVSFAPTVECIENCAFHQCTGIKTILFTSEPLLVYPFDGVTGTVYYPDNWSEVPKPEEYGFNSNWVSYPESSIPGKYKPVSISGASISQPASQTYTGNSLTPSISVVSGNTVLEKDVDYTVEYADNINAGTASVKIIGKGMYTGTAVTDFSITKAKNTLTAKGKTVKKSYKKVRKAKQTIKAKSAFAVSKNKGAVTYKVKKYDTKAKKKITVSQKGVVTIKKGLKKGTYKVKVSVSAAGNKNYKKLTKTVTLTVKITKP